MLAYLTGGRQAYILDFHDETAPNKLLLGKEKPSSA